MDKGIGMHHRKLVRYDYSNVKLDRWIIMLNHIHGIIRIINNRINKLRGTPGYPVWQRNYYEHIIRHENELNEIKEYIVDNSSSWNEDIYNSANKKELCYA